MLQKYKERKSGFTLLEILIVVALIAVLAVISILMLNPGEAQKKTRDAQRIRDIASLQQGFDQYAADFGPTTFTATSLGGTNSCAVGGWFGRDVCKYFTQLPIDPKNKVATVVNSSGSDISAPAQYEFMVDLLGQYRICTRMESKGNAAKMTSDGGLTNDFLEVFNNTSALPCI